MLSYINLKIEQVQFMQALLMGHFIVVYLVAKPLIWSKAEDDLVVIETSI